LNGFCKQPHVSGGRNHEYLGEYSFDRQRGSSAGKIDRGTDVTYHTSHDGRCQSTVSESAAEGPGFSITWDFYFKTSNTVPIEVNLNSKGLVSIEQYQVHEGEIHGLKGDVHELDGRLKELNADLNAINVDISTKETNLSKKSTGVKNLNNVIENGCFTINPDVTTECLPIYEWLTLLVMNSGFGGIIQIAFVVDGSKMFARTYNAGGAGWSEWRQVF
jgi:hypothetical protein